MDRDVFKKKYKDAEDHAYVKIQHSEFTGLIAKVVQSIAEELREIKILLRERRNP